MPMVVSLKRVPVIITGLLVSKKVVFQMERKDKWHTALGSGAAAHTLLRVGLLVAVATLVAIGALPVSVLGHLVGLPGEAVPSGS